jgi:hypothetical protein
MTILASEILDKVRTQLVDIETTQRWSDAELLQWLSDGQRVIASIEPSASSTVSIIELVAGTRQTIPTGGNMLLNVMRNIKTDGTTPGRAVRLVLRDMLDTQNPDWHAAAPSTVISNYMYDPAEREAFYVYPPASTSARLQINYSATPTEITSVSTAIGIRDIYSTALFNYVLYCAHMKDSDFAGGQQTAAAYLQMANAALSGLQTGDSQNNPNLQVIPFNPGAKGAAK